MGKFSVEHHFCARRRLLSKFPDMELPEVIAGNAAIQNKKNLIHDTKIMLFEKKMIIRRQTLGKLLQSIVEPFPCKSESNLG